MSDEKEQPPMRVSQWTRTEKTQEARPVSSIASDRPVTGPVITSEEKEPEFALPVDPWRLLGGVWKRRRWLWLALGAGVALGLGVGLFKARTRYIVSVQLIKRDTPSTFRTSEVGEAFRPRQLSGGTLLGAAASDNVLQAVARKSTPPVTVQELQGGIELKEQRNTDFVFLTLSGFRSPAATVDLANLWAAEVVQFTRELQSQESREMRQFLQQQVESTDVELRRVNDQILEFSKREDLVDVNKQIDSYLRSFEEVDLKYETARINLETIEFKISGVQEELKRQSPISEKLRTARSELEALRARYTDENPLVGEKLETVKGLQKQIEEAVTAPPADPSSYAGTFLGNTLYLNLIQYQNEKKALSREKEELSKLRDLARGKLDAIPQKAAAFAQLGLRRQSLEIARNLLFSRLREAQMFEENSPGYYRIFQAADISRVVSHGRFGKMFMILSALTAAGFFAGLIGALVLELLDPVLRTPDEAALALRVPVLGVYPKTGADPGVMAEIWTRWITASGHTDDLRVIWAPSPEPQDRQFWEMLFNRASVLLPSLKVVYGGEVELPVTAPGAVKLERVSMAAFSIQDARRFVDGLHEECRRGQPVWLYLSGPVQEPLTTLARGCSTPLVLVSLHKMETDFWKSQGDLLSKTVATPIGLVALGDIPWNQW